MEPITETVEGYVVDIACLRKYAVAEMPERASVHTRECTLMGHCVESGFALVGDDGRITLLDSEAPPHWPAWLAVCERMVTWLP